MQAYRNRTTWEVIGGEARYILKGRSALGSNDHPIKTYNLYMQALDILPSSTNKCSDARILVLSCYSSNTLFS